jgi:hypothetical protein
MFAKAALSLKRERRMEYLGWPISPCSCGSQPMTARYFILLLISLSVAGCDNSLDRPIHFVIPNDFTGPFVIVVNPDHPDRIVEYADRYQLTIPEDGVICTENIDIFRRWHQTTVAYANGTVLSSPENPSDQFHAGETETFDNRTFRSWYFVGPYAKSKEFFYGESSWEHQKNWLESRGLSR